ncbi:hypothetical protein L226DRAFT_312793 [Lentinus tigrinus ALCF2SS1-7]|uniref:uncharacterized protein n=1 Tax=Lentinus tigrinus ALCF2SS1-7 TaxID=1328758 RepID=UPI00116628B9|nr:hypothetical protein L226DRAFT_312793 [Lentinus tigrinus ALCF2SS1-7]
MHSEPPRPALSRLASPTPKVRAALRPGHGQLPTADPPHRTARDARRSICTSAHLHGGTSLAMYVGQACRIRTLDAYARTNARPTGHLDCSTLDPHASTPPPRTPCPSVFFAPPVTPSGGQRGVTRP